MRKLVEKTIPIIKNYEAENINNGYGNNIYSLLNAERDEVMTHEVLLKNPLKNYLELELEITNTFLSTIRM